MAGVSQIWNIVLLVALLFEGVLMVSAGLTGMQRNTLTGSRLLGILMLIVALAWLIFSLLAESGSGLLAIGGVVLSVLFLLGVRRAGPPPASS